MERKQRRDAAQLAFRRRVRRNVIAFLGGECAMCYERDEDVLQVDHKHGAREGHQDTGRSGYSLYMGILKGRRPASDFQLLCANCNMRKRLAEGEHRGYKARRFGSKEPTR